MTLTDVTLTLQVHVGGKWRRQLTVTHLTHRVLRLWVAKLGVGVHGLRR